MEKQTAGAETDVELNQPQPDQTVKPRPAKRPFPWAVALLGLILVLAGIWYLVRKQTNIQPTPATTANGVAATTESNTASALDEGVIWQKPEQLADLGLIQPVSKIADDGYQSTTYWKVATKDGQDEIILANVVVVAMGDTTMRQYFLHSGDTYYYLPANSEEINGSDNYSLDNTKLASGKIKNGTLILQALSPDMEIIKGETRLLADKGYWARINWDGIKQWQSATTKVGTTKWGPLFLHQEETITGFNEVKRANYYILLADGTGVMYGVRPTFARDDNTFKLQPGSKLENRPYLTHVPGCGTGGTLSVYSVVGTTWKSDQLVGQTEKGSKLYASNSATDPTATIGFKLATYAEMVDANPKITIADVVSKKGVVYWVDDYGTTQAYLRDDFQPAVECGKPVVYLYPTKTMPVSVKVGAQVRLSEPTYGDGWQTIAHPNGQLEVAGKTYPNLFWEGKGNGIYPAINVGQVVARAAAESTIKANLTEMGLTAKETGDFLGFWAPKLPTTPYVRLTWLTNRELDRLAPLTIIPKPDSVIRVFLDFAGLDAPVQLPAQRLPHFERNGFTAVEWGGLLVGEN